MSEIKDSRFSKLHTDPRFIKAKRDDAKVVIDSRFAGMLAKNSQFSSKSRMDKKGRVIQSKSTTNDMARFYRQDKEVHNESKELSGFDIARGRADIVSSDDEDALENVDTDDDIPNAQLEEIIPTGDESRRLALVNLDWDHIHAADIYKLVDSFTKNGKILVYKSDFGKERMAQEVLGPPSAIFPKEQKESLIQQDSGQEFDQDELRKYQLDRLRYYYCIIECNSIQVAKAIYDSCDGNEFESSANFLDLRYVPDDVEFSSKDIKEEANESNEKYQPKEFITKALQHTKVSLTWDIDDQERIAITKRKFTKEDLKDMDFRAYVASDSEASDEGEEDIRKKYKSLIEGVDDEVHRASGDEVEGDMEITFTPGLSKNVQDAVDRKRSGAAVDESVFDRDRRLRKEKKKSLKKAAVKDDDGLSIYAQYVDLISDEEGDVTVPDGFDDDFFQNPKPSRKLKGAAKEVDESLANNKAELELLMASDITTTPAVRHFDAKDILKQEKLSKKKQRKRNGEHTQLASAEDGLQSSFQIDVDDTRFAALGQHEFYIDPTSSKFKKTGAMEKLRGSVASKSRVIEKTMMPVDVAEPVGGKSADLAVLIEAVKRKSNAAIAGNRKTPKKAKTSF